MENVRNLPKHQLNIDDRDKGIVTGIEKMVSFDETLIVLVTSKGKLTIKGKNLHVVRVDVKQGELEFSGTADSLVYTENHAISKGAKGVFKRMFQ